MSNIATTCHDIFIGEKVYRAELSPRIRHWKVLAWPWDIPYTTYEPSRDRAAGEKGRENEHRCLTAVGWGSSCSWRWIDSKAAAKRPTLLCVFFRPLPLVPAPASSHRANPARHPCLLQPPYHAAPRPLLRSIAPERFTANRKISATGSSLRALRFNRGWLFLPRPSLYYFLPYILSFPTSVENPKRISKTKIGFLVTGGRHLNGQLAAGGEFLESSWNSPVDSQFSTGPHSLLTIRRSMCLLAFAGKSETADSPW